MSWKNRIVGHGEQAAISFMANPLNWRIHPKAQREALTGVLSEVGWVQSVIVNRTTGNVVDGHARIEEALKLGDETPVPFVEVELSEEEEKQVLLTLDPISAMAAADKQNLDSLLHDVSTASGAVADMLTELAVKNGLEYGATIGGELEDAEPQVDRADELRHKWGVESGQIWRLGEHRLMCGDSTKAEDVERLMDGAKADMMVTDLPYGVEYDPSWRAEVSDDGPNSNRAVGKVANDDRADWTEAWQLFDGDVAYVWHADRYSPVVAGSLEATGLEVRYLIVWAKQRHTFGRGHYHHQHEPCWCVVRKGATASWAGDRKQTTLWQIDSNRNNDTGHGTQKPVECMARPIRNHDAESVYDPFLGSGTTLIAAEQLGRKCYGMEISPAYVAVALERWSQATGKTPELVA